MSRNKILKLCFVIPFCVFVFAACNSNVVYDKNKSVDEKAWSAKDKLFYEVEITDTTQQYKVALNVRNTTDYPY
ncbi:MAG: hypothetical protein U0M28_07555, partial [Bacteroidales bacterium]|nr:hypothetical protein [Bacteroidales bacterium]